MKLATETKSDAFINRHKLHIYNRGLSLVVLLGLSPLFFGISWVLRSVVADRPAKILLFLVVFIVTGIVTQLVGTWIHKKPRSSKWYWLYYN